MHNFKDLRVWQKAVELVVAIYQATENFPNSERYNLISQMQRAATSIPSNIAEGCGRGSNPAFKQFLGIALGSSYELTRNSIILSQRLRLLSMEAHDGLAAQVTEVQRMISGLSNTL